jgi:hypothetical protein
MLIFFFFLLEFCIATLTLKGVLDSTLMKRKRVREVSLTLNKPQ